MKNIVLVSHGAMAEGIQSALEMIAGKQENLHTVTLRPDGDNLQFETDLLTKMKTLAGKVIIIADLLGGTPANVSLKNYSDNPEVEIITGLSLPLVLECVLGGDRTPDELLESAKATMVNVKSSLEEEHLLTKKEITDELSKYGDYAGQANIVNARIDERLIHGQVAGIWSSTLNTHRFIVANDEAAKDNLQRSALRMAAPKSMRLSVLNIEDAVKNINAGKYGKQRIFLLFKNPTDVLRFVQSGGNLVTVNVGNMSHKESTTEVTKNIYVTAKEKEVFNEIAASGINITAQLVPNEPVTDFIKKLNS